MVFENKPQTIQWEVSIIELQSGARIKFKVTRRIPALSVSETKVFDSQAEAKKQLEDWLQ